MGHTCVVNLEDEESTERSKKGTQRVWCPEESVSGGSQMLLRGQVRSGPKLTTEFSNVEKFGELGKGRFCGEVEGKA